MTISAGQLHKIMPNANKSDLDRYAPLLSAAMQEFEINTPDRQAAFLAQIAHESGSLHYVAEIADGRAYEQRADLGNLKKEALTAAHGKQTTSGRFYKGRGLIQITGFNNFRACGEALGADCINNPERLSEPALAARSAAWFWHKNKLNELADDGNFKTITRIINGGYNGLVERQAFYETAKAILT